MKIEEKYHKAIAVAIAIQKEGQATLDEIKEKLDEMKEKGYIPFTLTEKQIDRECKKLQKKSLISVNYINEDGRQVLAYSPQKPLFKRGIEGMRFIDIVDSDVAEDTIRELDKKKGANKGREPDICRYYTAQVKWQVTDEVGILGFMPRTKQEYLEHYRDKDNKIILLPKHFRAYVRENQRLVNKTNFHNYCVFDYGRVNLNGAKKTNKMDQFVIDGKQGRGSRTFEVIPKGSFIETTFRVPGKGGLDAESFRKFLEITAPNPIRGLSGASSMGFGRMKLLEFKLIA